jgi:hypothetical protein
MNLLSTAFSAVDFFNSGGRRALLLRLFSLLAVRIVWWIDMRKERHVGLHTAKLETCMRTGILLFILREVFFFVSFF